MKDLSSKDDTCCITDTVQQLMELFDRDDVAPLSESTEMQTLAQQRSYDPRTPLPLIHYL